MSKVSRLALWAVGAALLVVLVSPALGRADGKQLFLDKKCNKCHSIKALGIEKIKAADPDDAEGGDGKEAKGPDLSGAGLENRDAAWFGDWLAKKVKKKSVYDESREVFHKKKVELAPDELKQLVDFLNQQKKRMD